MEKFIFGLEDGEFTLGAHKTENAIIFVNAAISEPYRPTFPSF